VGLSITSAPVDDLLAFGTVGAAVCEVAFFVEAIVVGETF